MQEKRDKKWSVRPERDQDQQRQVRACLPCLLHSSGIISRTGSGKKPTDLGASADHEMSELK